METDELKKRAVASLLEQRTIVFAETEEAPFEKAQNLPAKQSEQEFEKRVTGHMGFSSRPTSPLAFWKTAGTR